MSREGLRAVVLAAGHGMRLRPLTEKLPKPLLPVRGRPILAHTLEQLAAWGCESAAINLHHLGDTIPAALGDEWAGMPLVYSREPELLGTLGALAALRDFIEPASEIILVNGDSLCRWPFGALMRRHRRRGSHATLLFAAGADPANFGGGVGLDKENRVVDFGIGEESPDAVRRHVFAGAHILSPEILMNLEVRTSDIVRDLYVPMLADGANIEAVLSRRPWHDLGTPGRYLEGALEPPRNGWRKSPAGWTSAEARVDEKAQVEDSLVEKDVQVLAGCDVRRSMLLPGARLAPGCRIEEAIVNFGTTLLPGTTVRRRLVTPAIPGRDFGPDASLVGGMAYIPLGASKRTGAP